MRCGTPWTPACGGDRKQGWWSSMCHRPNCHREDPVSSNAIFQANAPPFRRCWRLIRRPHLANQVLGPQDGLLVQPGGHHAEFRLRLGAKGGAALHSANAIGGGSGIRYNGDRADAEGGLALLQRGGHYRSAVNWAPVPVQPRKVYFLRVTSMVIVI